MAESIRLLFADALEELSRMVTAMPPRTMAEMYRGTAMPFDITTNMDRDYNGSKISVIGQIVVGTAKDGLEEEEWWTDMDVSTNNYNRLMPVTLKFVTQDALCGMAHQLANYNDGKLEKEYAEATSLDQWGEPCCCGIMECVDKKAKTIDCGELFVCVRLFASAGWEE